ncbi:DUF3658 domain-containing protein [Nocardia terpenica]|uniref:DUF3658 domain-containing protein n=1 Tax=Nocardia terpenica TaxID=455432 RepID=UPI002FE37BA4
MAAPTMPVIRSSGFPIPLSTGPLEPDNPAVRLQWWQWWADMVVAEGYPDPVRPGVELAAFWDKVDAADHLVVWYGRGNAGELSFFHALCDKLPDRPFDVVELPGATGARTPRELAPHLATARPITADERAAARRTWQRLERENQTFRIISGGELVSAPADHYDDALLDTTGSDWTPILRVVAPVMAEMKVADSPLFWRVKSLVESGVLVADGDPWLVRQAKVKRAQPQRT